MTNSQVSFQTSSTDARDEFLRSLIGRPYRKNARGPDEFDCWHLAVYVQKHLYGREAPNVEVPEKANWGWMIEQFTTHPELGNWIECLQPSNGLVNALDGAMVLMARMTQPAHCGVYCAFERSIIHADENVGVIFQSLQVVKSNGWSRLRFYEPR